MAFDYFLEYKAAEDFVGMESRALHPYINRLISAMCNSSPRLFVEQILKAQLN
jgi:hypothetical protein